MRAAPVMAMRMLPLAVSLVRFYIPCPWSQTHCVSIASNCEPGAKTAHKVAVRGGVQTVKTFAPIKTYCTFKFVLSKETHTMDAAIKTALVIAFAIVALLLLFFGGGMMTGTMMSGGMMGSGSMGGISWMWLPTLLVVVLGVVLFSVFFGKK